MSDKCKHCGHCKDGCKNLCACCGACQDCGQKAAPTVNPLKEFIPMPFPEPVYPPPYRPGIDPWREPDIYPKVWWGTHPDCAPTYYDGSFTWTGVTQPSLDNYGNWPTVAGVS